MDRLTPRDQDPIDVKKPYSSPEVKTYGTLTELTGTAFGTAPDGGGPFAFSGGAG